MKPPFRVEHVGSFIRPRRLLEAVRSKKLSAEELRAVQDDAIREIVAFQESLGLPSITDGEFRRRSWSAGFIDAVEGFGLRDGTLAFRDETGIVGVASSPYAKTRLRRKRRIVADDFRFLKSVVKRGVPKVTIAAPDVMHYFLGPQAFDPEAYGDRELYLEDLERLYREEITDLANEGCTYLQLDDTALPCNCDARARQDVSARGEDADELTERYVRLFNECVATRPRDMTVAIHLCRGNLKGAWMADGGYEPIAEALFERLDAQVYCLEYDTARAGDFAPLRFLPEGKRVILGLVSTKTPALEDKDALKRRIDAAARHAPLDRLGIGPQCGFSSVGGGNQSLTPDDTRRKLERVMEVAREVWG
ncbi:MAG TPA: 5-methyltetrahydropteroyltriglutamate--homocysteine S-methyltransferase [Burkholderiales bacterium]|nr:5-methyltetrahydropteroyltriglutamate--homocysteine S-methyltransferase [Burkholderiales bacterium]